MPNKKYTYFLTHDGKLCHADSDHLEHWKYTRREWKNGKWKYYYDNDPIGIKRFIETRITNDAQKQHMEEEMDAWRKRVAEAEKELAEFEKNMTFRIEYEWSDGAKHPDERTHLYKGEKVTEDEYYRLVRQNTRLYESEQAEYNRLWNATKELSPQTKNVRDGKAAQYYYEDKNKKK